MKRSLTTHLLPLAAASFFALQCGYISQFQNTLANLQRCKFKLQGVRGMTVAGVDFSSKRSLGDFNLFGDGARLTEAFARHALPAQFTLEVAATNPNDGTGGTTKTSATLVGMPWSLLIDGKPTVSGDIGSRVQIPGTGQTTVIPLPVSLDLYQFFGNNGYEDVIKLALAIGGVQGSAARLTLRGTPRISTPLGDISYPHPVNIVDKEFRN